MKLLILAIGNYVAICCYWIVMNLIALKILRMFYLILKTCKLLYKTLSRLIYLSVNNEQKCKN